MNRDIIKLNPAAARLARRSEKAAYTGDYVSAIYYLKRALRLSPENEGYLVDLASLQNQVAHYEDAVANLFLAELQEGEKTAREDIYYLLGEAYFGMSMTPQASFYLSLCMKENPRGQYAEDAAYLLGEISEIAEPEKPEDYYARLSHAENLYYAADYKGAEAELRGLEKAAGADAYISAFLAMALLRQAKYEESLACALRAQTERPEAILPAVTGLEAALHLNSEKEEARFKNALLRIKDYSPADISALSEFFDRILPREDGFAKALFLHFYKDNAFDKQILFALAAAHYHTGSPGQGLEVLQKLSRLEGGTGVAAAYIAGISETEAENAFPYTYGLTPFLQERIAKNGEEDLETALLLPAAQVEELLGKTEFNPLSAYLVRCALLNYEGDMTAKSVMARWMQENKAEEPVLINTGYEIITADMLAGEEGAKTLEINQRLTARYTPQQLVQGLVDLWAEELPEDIAGAELSVALEYLVCRRNALPFDLLEACLQMGVDPSRLSALLTNETKD